MSFDKYLFEKYTKDCVVEILSPNQGTGFWVLPDGYLLTCYHVLITKHKDLLGNDVVTEHTKATIRYHGQDYLAEIDPEHSKKELDIAALKVNAIEEKFHFVSLGDPELNAEVQVFGYRVGDNEMTFKNGYHISGILRLGQVLSERGLVYNLETNQPPNSSVRGMSGSPVYDLNTTKIIGLQGSEESKGPSICYVHPIEKVYKLWPELRIKNLTAIRADFNTYFMTGDLLRSVFILIIVLLQSQLESVLDKTVLDSAEQKVYYVQGEKTEGKLHKILSTRIGAQVFRDFIKQVNSRFYRACTYENMCTVFDIPTCSLLSIQAALDALPKVLNQKDALRVIGKILERDYPGLTDKQIKTGLNLYVDSLVKELLPLTKFLLSVIVPEEGQIFREVENSDNKLVSGLLDLEKIVAQRGIYMTLDDSRAGFGNTLVEENDKEARVQILIIEEMLNNEAPYMSGGLSNWQPDEHPSYFLQQVYNRIPPGKGANLRQTIEGLLFKRNQAWLARCTPKNNPSIKHPHPIRYEVQLTDSLDLSFTPDGKRVISSASFDQTVYLFDIESGRSLSSFEGRASGVLCNAIVANGKYAFFASSDRTIVKWDLESGRWVRTLRRERSHIWKIALLPNTQNAILAFSDNTLQLKNLETEAVIREFVGHKKPCSSLAVSTDGAFFVSASNDMQLRLWEVNSDTSLHVFDGHTGEVYSVAIVPNNRQIVSASEKGELWLWDLKTGQRTRVFQGHTKQIHGIAMTPDSKYIISASADKTIRLWEISTGKCLLILTGNRPFRCIAISPNGSLFAVGDQTGEIHLFEIRNALSLM
jgi:WD40 repeat protein